jgi:acyl-coenzyme A thioesterase PaaI-like protein
MATPTARLRALWRRLAPLPGGKRLFSLLLGRIVPYTGSIAPIVLELRPGYAKVAMRDTRRVRNHLRSVHAIAQMNLAEVTSGLALTVGLPDDVRGIVTQLRIEYLKKARGALTAESTTTVPDVHEAIEHVVEAVIRDADGDPVARASAYWRLAPQTERTPAAAGA